VSYQDYARFFDQVSGEAHQMWHAGATREDVRKRVTDRIGQFWSNTGHPGKPPPWSALGLRWVRRIAVRRAYSAQACQDARLPACGAPREGVRAGG
jgi:hypothetical protein